MGCTEANHSRVKEIDNSFCKQLILAAEGNTPANIPAVVFAFAAELGCLRMVSMLLSNNYVNDVDPTYDSYYAICMASDNGHIAIVKLLLSVGRVVSSTDKSSALLGAITNGHIKVIQLLISDGCVDPSANGLTRTIQFARSGETDSLRRYNC